MAPVKARKFKKVSGKGSTGSVLVVHPDGSRSRVLVPTKSLTTRVREEAAETKRREREVAHTG